MSRSAKKPKLLVRARVDPASFVPHVHDESETLPERVEFLLRRLEHHALVKLGPSESVPAFLRERFDHLWPLDTSAGLLAYPDPIDPDNWEEWNDGALARAVSSGPSAQLRDDVLALVGSASTIYVFDRYALSSNSLAGWKALLGALRGGSPPVEVHVYCCQPKMESDGDWEVPTLLAEQNLGERLEIRPYPPSHDLYAHGHDRFILLQLDDDVPNTVRSGVGWWAAALGQGVRAISATNKASWVHVIQAGNALEWLRIYLDAELPKLDLSALLTSPRPRNRNKPAEDADGAAHDGAPENQAV